MKKLIFILPIIFEAVSEALELKGLKIWGKQVEMLELASWFFILYMVKEEWFKERLFHFLLIYFLLRVAFFNYIWNFTFYVPDISFKNMFYIGTVSFYDRVLALLAGNNVWWYVLLMQVICLVFLYFVIKRKI